MAEPTGRLIIVSAPSGAGKSTIVRHLLQKFPDRLAFSVSVTTRKPREGEQHGREYYFIDKSEFEKMIAGDELLEWEEVYPGVKYGTPWSELRKNWLKGKVIVFDVDVAGGSKIKARFGDAALDIFVSPPSIEILEQRLLARGTDSPESIKKRLEKVRWEMQFENTYSHVIINDKLDDSLQMAEEITLKFLNKE